jgi:hypothetical protein
MNGASPKMSETKTVNIRLPNGAIKECSVDISTDPQYEIIFSGLRLTICKFSGLDLDLSDAFNALRRELEKMGLQLLCAGARQDVFPSGMSRSMGGGRKAYITRLGFPGGPLVDIFDYSESEILSSIAQQEKFHKEWIESLRQ